MNSTDLAYIAGIIDGEGCIFMTKRIKPGGRQAYSVGIHISNTRMELINWLNDRLGRLGTRLVTKRENTNWREGYSFEIAKFGSIYALLRLLEPCLVIKNKQAKNVCKFISTKFRKESGAPSDSNPEQFYQKMKALNQKGRIKSKLKFIQNTWTRGIGRR